MGRMLKAIERAGRRLLLWLLALACGLVSKPRPVLMADREHPWRILVVRLDERLGNAILLTPVLASLKAMYPKATVDLVVAQGAVHVLHGHPHADHIYAFNKRAVLGAQGFGRTWRHLRRAHYHLAIDGANPTSPSLTHALMVATCGAANTIGHAGGGLGRLYSRAVPRAHNGSGHEIDLRLRLLDALPPPQRCRRMQVSPHMAIANNSALPSFLRSLDGALFVLINVGARTAPKQLSAADYAVVANSVTVAGMVPVLSFGPQEAELAEQVAKFSASTVLAPPTTVSELAWLMQRALCVISCDTGPMHLAVALGAPTCGLFVVTDPARYGHNSPPHAVIDVRAHADRGWLTQLRSFLTRQRLCVLKQAKTPALLPEEMTPLLVDGAKTSSLGGLR